MEKEEVHSTWGRGNVVGGAVLIVIGLLFLLGQWVDIQLGRYLWPFTIVVPGVALFLGALAVDKAGGKALAIAGGVVTMVGLIFFVQSLTDLWASWAYAWALVAPTGAGAGLWLFGTIKNDPEPVRSGKELVRLGLIIFVVAAVFFELIIGINGYGVGRYGLPLLLIVVGLFLLGRNMSGAWRKA